MPSSSHYVLEATLCGRVQVLRVTPLRFGDGRPCVFALVAAEVATPEDALAWIGAHPLRARWRGRLAAIGARLLPQLRP